ncbi:acetyltransferase [Peloplasma aerotolerans]|uniref:Acetyltransferase n=1 Tax=Peloplasma aerotolerans TaxID=3044389 RepID=A0AAW6U355_9MOLU|nr:acetyltransferase [Mariniplasma sp. M4Ah]MDI6452391.1 acetyltransferase [Mariniplasma sp. M4Ah]
MNKRILLVGGGGHCKSVLDTLVKLNIYTEIKIIDKKENIGNSVMGFSIIGEDKDLPDLFQKGYNYAFITVGSVGDTSIRIKLFNMLKTIGYQIPTIVDPSSKVSKYSRIEEGVFIGKLSIVNADAIIQECAIINSGSIVEHDCQIGSFAHISPGAVLGGEVIIGNNTHVGLNATIMQQIKIGSNSIIGMGSIVNNNINNNKLAYGTPCKEVKNI